MTEPSDEHRRVYAGTTTEAVVRNVRDTPAILRRYWPYSLVAAMVGGAIAWWIAGDLIAGVIAATIIFVCGFIAGWGLEPFLPRDRRVIAWPR